MPNIAEKSKVFGGKGVVLSFTRAPDVFLYRELIPGTKKYRYKVIDGANTLEAAIDKSLDAYNALRSEILEHAQEVAIRKAQYEIETNSPRRRARMITENMVRSKKVSIRKCLNNFLDEEQKKVDADLLKEKSLQNKAQGLKQLEKYLSYKGIEKTHQIDNNTFHEYITWRKAKKSTRRIELIYFKDFLISYCKPRGLLINSLDEKRLMPKIVIKESEVDANPPLIEEGNWNLVVKTLKQMIKNRETGRGPAKYSVKGRGVYFNQLFYRWCLICKNSGLRPNIELNKLRWCDVKRENAGRWSKSKGETEDKWIAIIYIKDTKTGKQRAVPTNGVDSQLLEWRKEQKEYLSRYYPDQKIKDTDLIFGNPANEMKQFPYSMFNTIWIRMIELCGDELKPYVFSDRNYTPYSLRSTFICNLILQGKDIYDVAKLAGHSIAVCERYYAKRDMGRKSKELTEIEYGIKGRRKTIISSYLED